MVISLLALACAIGPPPSGTDTADTGDTADTADTGPDPDTLDQDGDGYRPLDGDCDDRLPHVYPGAPDFCDRLDQDCDGEPIPDGSCGTEGDATLGWRWAFDDSEVTQLAGTSLGDVDGDEREDLAAYRWEEPEFDGIAGPLFGARLDSLPAQGPMPPLAFKNSFHSGCGVGPAGDVNADGYDDLWVVLTLAGSGGRAIHLVHGGTPGLPPDEVDPAQVAVVSWVLGGEVWIGGQQTGDFNGDGAPDHLVDYQVDEDRDGLESDDPHWLALLGGSVGFLGGSDFDAYPHTVYDMYSPEVVPGLPTTVGDLDGDGADELAVTAREATGPLDSLAIVSGLELAVGGGVFSTLAVRSALDTTEYHHFDLTAPALGANTDADGDGYDDLEVGVYFPDRAESVILYASGSIPDGSLDDAVYARIENMAQSPWLLYRGADLDGDGAADSVAQHCLLPTTRFAEGGTFEHADVAGPCLGLAGYLRVLEDMTGDGLPEWVFNDLYGSADGHNRVLIVEGFPIPWDDPEKW